MRFLPDLVQLLIVLERTDPPVWRRVHVSFFTKLGGLHRVIQAVMGWDGLGPHRFILQGDIYERVAPGEALDAKRERNWRLDSAFYPGDWLTYAYGAPDERLHRIVREEYVDGVQHWRYPRCVAGAGASPPGSAQPFDVARVNRRLWRAKGIKAQ